MVSRFKDYNPIFLSSIRYDSTNKDAPHSRYSKQLKKEQQQKTSAECPLSDINKLFVLRVKSHI